MNLNKRIKEISEERFTSNEASKFIYAIMLDLTNSKYFEKYPKIVYKGYINEFDINTFDEISKKIESFDNVEDMSKLTHNEFYTLSAFISYLDSASESDISSVKDLFNIRKFSYIRNFSHFDKIILDSFKIKNKEKLESNIFYFIDDYNFLNFKSIIPILLNDQLNYTIQKTNFYQKNINEINEVVSILKKEYPELDKANDNFYKVEIEKEHRKMQTFESIFNNLSINSKENYLFSMDNYKNLLPFSKTFNITNKIENISFQFYELDNNLIFIEDLNISDGFYKEKAISMFKDHFKDSIILTSSKNLEENFGFKIINIKDKFENFHVLNKKIGKLLNNININIFLEKFHDFDFKTNKYETFEKEFNNSIKKSSKLKM